MTRFLTVLLLAAMTSPVTAQWLNHPTPGIPRTSDGKPNLGAPTPHSTDGKPDLSGVWNGSPPALKPPEGSIQPWAHALMKQREETFFKDRPSYRCLPSGPEQTFGWKRIVQTPTLITILNDDLTYRLIFMDGRRLESEPNPSWMGYSVGRWEGNALVVDSFGFNDRTWLSGRGLPHTEALRITERYQRRDFGHLRIDVTITDTGTFSKPWSFPVDLELRPDTEVLEAVCESRQDHWVGTVSDARQSEVAVPQDVLTAYVGVYSGVWATRPRTVKISVKNGGLVATIFTDSVLTREDEPLVAQSPTTFLGAGDGLGYEFIRQGTGVATQVIERHVSGAYTFARQP